MYKKQRIIQNSILLTIGIVLILVFGLVIRNLNLTIENGDRVTHTTLVKESSERVISMLKDIETGQRGYIITKDSLYLEPYFNSHEQINHEIFTLKNLTQDNKLQQLRIDTLINFVAKRISRIDKSLIYLNENGPTQDFIQSLKVGKNLMDSCRYIISQIQQTEERLLEERTARLKMSISFTQISITTLLVTLIIFLIFSYFVLRYLQNKREQDQNQIHVLNAELTTMVEELRTSNEEIHAMNEELSSYNEELASNNEQLDILNGDLNSSKAEIEKLNSNLQTKLASVLENSMDLVCYTNRNNVIEYMNNAGRKLLEIEGDKPEKNILSNDYISDEDWNNIITPARLFLKENGFWQGDLTLKSKSGKLIPIWLQIITIKNEITGETNNAIIGRDLTKEKEAQAMLIKNESRYRLLFENNPQPMFIFDFETKIIIESNTAALSKYGYTHDEFIGLSISKLRPNSEIENFNQYIKDIIPLGYFEDSEWIHANKSGELIYVDLYSYGFELDGRIVRLVLANDITSKKKIKDNLLQINEELIQQNEQLDKYVYVVSHNIRGPVASLLGLVNMLNYEKWPEHIEPIIQNIYKTTEKLDSVIIDLNKVLSSRNNLNSAKENIEFRTLLNDIFEMLNDQIEISEALFELNIEFNEMNTVKSYIHSILFNLISNAIKYREITRPLKISISIKKNGGKVILTVSDNGLGIDLVKNKDKLFGLYKRFHFHIDGKGLGLHLVKSQVEALGGKIKIESEVDAGAKFIISLPLM